MTQNVRSLYFFHQNVLKSKLFQTIKDFISAKIYLQIHLGVLGFAKSLRVVFRELIDVDKMKLPQVNQKFVNVKVDGLVRIHLSAKKG